jgi:hypothetical protein
MSSKKILRWALDAATAAGPEKTLLLILAIHADGEGLISPGPSWSTLQRQSGLSRSTIHKAIRRLEDSGFIIRAERQRDNGSHSSCDYLLGTDTESATGPVRETDGYPSVKRTGTRPGNGPVRETDRLTRPGNGPVLTSTNGETRPSHGPPRPSHGPLEEKITTTTSSQPRARDAHTHTRASGDTDQPTPEQLAQSGISPDAYALVARWRANHNPRYRTGTYMAIGKEADAILRDHGDPDALTRALAAWDHRADARPGLLPFLYDDELRNARANTTRPLINPDGTTPIPVDQIPDDALTRAVLEEILGPDYTTLPLAPLDIDEDPAARAIWYRDAGAQRLAERRVEARRALAKWQTRGSG